MNRRVQKMSYFFAACVISCSAAGIIPLLSEHKVKGACCLLSLGSKSLLYFSFLLEGLG